MVTLAQRRALHLSMEWIIVNGLEWEPLSTDEDRTLARQRLETAGKLAGS